MALIPCIYYEIYPSTSDTPHPTDRFSKSIIIRPAAGSIDQFLVKKTSVILLFSGKFRHSFDKSTPSIAEGYKIVKGVAGSFLKQEKSSLALRR